jgi:hypothetical protein
MYMLVNNLAFPNVNMLGAGGVAQATEHQPSKCKTLSSNSSTSLPPRKVSMLAKQNTLLGPI